MQKTFIRGGILPLAFLENLKNNSKQNEYITLNDCEVKITSQRYSVFQKSQKCGCCGLEASYLAYEKPLDSEKYHINMYGVDEDGKEILFTKDHIIPFSKGGKNILGNYQTMCSKCDANKGNMVFSNGKPIIMEFKIPIWKIENDESLIYQITFTLVGKWILGIIINNVLTSKTIDLRSNNYKPYLLGAIKEYEEMEAKELFKGLLFSVSEVDKKYGLFIFNINEVLLSINGEKKRDNLKKYNLLFIE